MVSPAPESETIFLTADVGRSVGNRGHGRTAPAGPGRAVLNHSLDNLRAMELHSVWAMTVRRIVPGVVRFQQTLTLQMIADQTHPAGTVGHPITPQPIRVGRCSWRSFRGPAELKSAQRHRA